MTRSANRLTGRDQLRVLGNDPAMSYLKFGLIFLAAKRLEPAVKAFERGLVYDEDNPQISLLMADTLLKLNQGERALAWSSDRSSASRKGSSRTSSWPGC